MRKEVEHSLSNPVFDPERQIDGSFFWREDRAVSAGLTCNIGME